MTRTDADSFEAMARAALAALPAPFAARAADVVLRVEDWPDDAMLAEFGMEDPRELTGLYDGIPLTEKSVSDPAPFPDTVWLFREPILTEWRERGNVALEDLVAHVVVHEIAHHFGWSDDDIAEIDRWWE
ncbi:Possibl zinc metallo-peptidase [Roseivivax jejudonensis]|uniref:Possibl zinc metallo-peptidase n=1 Tax=Roseivivax jejudonensis TaxID=1529041 RepID=A0A1X7A324_9RHOB|nr:metallopeptidase family protein [Roseivivax jejudonensis]SLN67313.1 Possibl zinc metallo-peptidase [Roseivivax jejudonensis]